MAQPRRSSRRDYPIADRHQRIGAIRRCLPERADSQCASFPQNSDRIDPRRLIETAFRNESPPDAPETYVIAWLAVLPDRADAPRAAAHLADHLLRLANGPLTPWQRGLISLLAFVAKHRRRSSRDAEPFSARLASTKRKSP